jgi:hypothetical protein
MSDPVVLRCSFCNKSQRDVKKLIAGPTVYICDECVEVCNGILTDDGIVTGRGTRAASRAAVQAGEHLHSARTLLDAGEALGAAREVRNSALASMRGFMFLDDEGADRATETKVVMASLYNHPEIAELLHQRDSAHIILRVSLDGAMPASSDVATALDVAADLLARLRAAAEAADEKAKEMRNENK